MKNNDDKLHGLWSWMAAVRVFVCGALLVAALTGACRVGFAQADETVITLVAWEREGGPDLAMCSRMVNRYSETHPGVRVDMRHDDWSKAHEMLKRWRGMWRASAPDMVIVPDEWLGEFDGEFYTFGTRLEQELVDFIPGVLEPVRRDGRVFGVPWRMDALALYYRSDLLGDARLPETWAEMADVSKTMANRSQNVYGLGLPGAASGGGARLLLTILWGSGGELLDEAGEIDFTSVQMKEALGEIVKLAEAGALQPEVLSWSSEQCQQAFAEGRLGMVIAGSALAEELRKEYGNLHWAVAPLPHRNTPVAAIASTYLLTLRSSEHRDECLEFMRYMVSEEVREAMVASGSVPSHRRLIAKMKTDKWQSAFCANLENAHSRPTANWRAVEAMLDDAIYLALSGRSSVGDALDSVQARYDETRGTVAPPNLFGG